MFHGKWEIKGNTLCAEWRERPEHRLYPIRKNRRRGQAFDAKSGDLRAKILRTAPGNAETLAT